MSARPGAAGRARRHRRKPAQPGAADQPIEQRLGLIGRRVGDGEARDPAPCPARR